MRAIELRQLRYFSLLAEQLHFGRAAEMAFVSQPALSQQIAKLEETLGVTLLTRDRRGVALTGAGLVLRDGVLKVFEQLDQALRATRQATGQHEFRISIGMVEYTNLPFVPAALMRLQALYPDLKIERHEMNGLQQVEALPKRRIDVGFGVLSEPLPDGQIVRAEPLLSAGWDLLMRPTHRLAQLPRLRIEDLAGEHLLMFSRGVNPPLYDAVVEHCRAVGFVPNFVYETTQTQTAMSLVQQGVGAMLGASYVFDEVPAGLVRRPLDGFDRLTVNLIARNDEASPLVLDFMELAVEEARRVQLRLDVADRGSSGD